MAGRKGRDDKVWWVGFDCAHLYDLSPGYSSVMRRFQTNDIYKDVVYVKNEIESLANQLKKM